MKLFGNKKEGTGDKSSSPVASEKTKQSAGFLKRSVNKIGDILHKKFGSTEKITDTDSMSNAEYLGEIYKLMVQNSVDIKLEREQQVNFREEEDSEEQKRHSEIVKALTIRRRPKPKAVIRREKKAEEKAKEPPKKPGEPPKKPGEPTKPTEPTKPAEPAKKPAEPAKPAEKPVEKAKREVDDGVKKAAEEKAKKDAQEAAKKAAETKAKKEAEEKAKKAAEEKAKKETAEKLKKEEQEKLKREAAEKAKSEKLKKDAEPVKPSTATQKPPELPKTGPSTATQIGIGTAIAAATSISFAQEIGDKISTHESAGTSEKSYNIMNNAGKKDTNWNKYNLTNMSLQQVLELAEQRRIEFNPKNKEGKRGSIGVAMGKYQFMPSVLRGDSKNKGLAEKVFGPDWKNQPFNKENQERLHDAFFKDEVTQLKRLKVPVSEATIYMTHFAGPKGAAKIYFASDDTKMSDVMSDSQVQSNKTIAKLTVGEYKKKISTTKGKVIGLSFGALDEKKLNEFMQPQSNTGNRIDSASKDNKDMKKQDTPAPINIQQNTTNVNNTTESSNTPKVDDRPAHQRK
jgi:hypothetical protein